MPLGSSWAGDLFDKSYGLLTPWADFRPTELGQRLCAGGEDGAGLDAVNI